MGVSLNGGTPESSIFIGCSILNHLFLGTPIFGNTQMVVKDGDLLWSNPLKIAKIFVENLKGIPHPNATPTQEMRPYLGIIMIMNHYWLEISWQFQGTQVTPHQEIGGLINGWITTIIPY